MNQHTDNYIKSEFQEQHRVLCKHYKDSKTSAKADVRYLTIKVWWQSCGAADESSLKQFEQWLAFWHLRYRQWGAVMQMVSFIFSTFRSLLIKIYSRVDIQLCLVGPH